MTTRESIAVLQSQADAETERRLRDANDRLQRALAEVEVAQNARTDAIRAALEDGWTQARIAGVFGVSRGRIAQLVMS